MGLVLKYIIKYKTLASFATGIEEIDFVTMWQLTS